MQIAAGTGDWEHVAGVSISSSGHKALMTPLPTVEEAASDSRKEGCLLI